MQPDEPKRPADAKEDGFRTAVPQIALPKGGGAIRGIGENFTANPATGTGSLSVPIATTAGRSGFGPKLLLSYDSGAGNGPFGLGWNLSLPSITRRTDRGLPQYFDDEDSDVFILSGVEDLVPVLRERAGQWVTFEDTVDSGGQLYQVRRYRPRIEATFALIERWTHQNDATDVFWRTLSKDNITMWYGRIEDSRIADDQDAARIFSWLLCESYDDKGNGILYDYARESAINVDRTASHERNRVRTTNRYLKRIRYGNTPSRFAPDFAATVVWRFEVRFDYGGEEYSDEPIGADGATYARSRKVPAPNPDWPVRLDPFSMYRAGFEVRTYRLCRRVLMFHRFDELLGDEAQLVRSTELSYDENTAVSRVVAVRHCAFIPISETPTERRYRRRSLPPLELEYSTAQIDPTIRDIDEASLENIPAGLTGPGYEWVDLEGEGLSGILIEQGTGWFYKRNLAPLNLEADSNGPPRARAMFAPVEQVATKPNTLLAESAAQFMDLKGDGRPDLVVFDAPQEGFYSQDGSGTWVSFRAFTQRFRGNARDPNLRFIDLDGDGRADVLITEDDVLTWHPSLGEEGFGPSRSVSKERDEEAGPTLVFADGTQSIYVADMSGDGLADLVRIRNREICYWPNLGYGVFGAKVTMDHAPWFDAPEAFDQRRIRLADIDGSGPCDIVYLSGSGPRLSFNQSGNRWSDAQEVPGFPRLDSTGSVTVADLLGNGTACLVWSSTLPGEARRPMKYVDLMSGTKPHLLIGARNNLGASTRIEYAPSTKFYLEDKLAGRPWITRLPFPVHCVARVSVTDHWRNTTFSSTYSYHHGYFDGAEREFRGFGRVEQVDVEDYGTFVAANAVSPWITPDTKLYQPPVKTITWFHTGAALERKRILSQFRNEYFPNSVAARPAQVELDQVFGEKLFDEPGLESLDLVATEWREAMRACKGMVLRQETYELDIRNLLRPVKLFSAVEHTCAIRCLQRQRTNRHSVFLVIEGEAITYQYELDLTAGGTLAPDPRVTHTLNLSFDDYGNIQQSIAVGYARVRQFDVEELAEHRDMIREVQREQHVAYTETHYTGDAIDASNYRLRVPCEVQTYELSGVNSQSGRYFEIDDLLKWNLSTVYPSATGGRDIAPADYQDVPQTTDPTMRLVEHARTLFFNDEPNGADAANQFLKKSWPLGTLGKLGLVYERYKLALTDNLLDAVFTDGQLVKPLRDGANARARLRDPLKSGYVRGDIFAGGSAQEYWMRSGVAGFAADAPLHFYLPERFTDSFGNPTSLEYDGQYDLFIRSSTDALGNTTSIEAFDYRVMSPSEQKDVTANYTSIAFDILGTAVAVAGMGKQRTESGDALTGLASDLPQAAIAAFLTSPYDPATPRQWLANATSRYFYDFGDDARPPCAGSIGRTAHVAAGGGDIQVGIEYSDGLGTVLVKKSQAEPAVTGGALRWIASGKTVLNNKRKAVKQYEPYFSGAEHQFDRQEIVTEVGVTPILYYDAPGRLVRTDAPDASYSRVEFTPWQVRNFDANDTVHEAGNAWYAARSGANGTPEEQRAASLALVHHGTPSLTVLDSLGRQVIAIAHNRIEDGAGEYPANGKHYRNEYYLTYTKLDAEGKPLWVRDARGNLVMQYLWPPKPNRDEPRTARDFRPNGNPNNDIGARVPTYDIAGTLLFQHSMDAGNRWMINDAAGKPMCAWDFNERQDDATTFVDEQRLYSTEYDRLHRPLGVWLQISDDAARNIERFEYQDSKDALGAVNPNLDALQAANLIGQLVGHYDESGFIATAKRDFKGNTLEAAKQLNSAPTESIIDWQGAHPEQQLAAETFRQLTEYDALNRITTQYNWHRDALGSPVAKYEPIYNERGVLAKEWLTVRGRPRGLAVREIAYDEQGRKTRLVLGNGTTTQYDYDRQTFRLRQLRTTRLLLVEVEPDFPEYSSDLVDSRIIQQLHYTYDPSGNVAEIFDEAFAPVFFQNQRVEPHALYEYDALYRLISASGRENGALQGAPMIPEIAPVDAQFSIQPGDPNALRKYRQTFTYDAVGNLDWVHHEAGGGTWNRRFHYADDSNRMVASWDTKDKWEDVNLADVTPHASDTHGNMRNLLRTDPHFHMRWDHRDMLRFMDLGGGGKAYYQYDAGKQRVRKRIENQNGRGGYWERIYLGGYELYRRYNAAGGAPVEELESVHLFVGEQRVLLVDDVIAASGAGNPRPDDLTVKAQTLFRYQYSNHLGSSVIELDEQAAIISFEEYHPYGTSGYSASARGREAPLKRYRYAGMERDEESGLNYHTARYYCPFLGRWASPDATGLQDGTNIFAYAQQNPTRMIDREGAAAFDAANAGKEWEKQILGLMKQSVPLVEQVTVIGTVKGKKVETILDGLAKTDKGWTVIELKLYDKTKLSKPQQQLLELIEAGRTFEVRATTPQKLEQLREVLNVSPGAKLNAGSHILINQNNANSVLKTVGAVGKDERAVLVKSGKLLIQHESEVLEVEKFIQSKGGAIEWESALKQVREIAEQRKLEQQLATNADTATAKVASKGSKAVETLEEAKTGEQAGDYLNLTQSSVEASTEGGTTSGTSLKGVANTVNAGLTGQSSGGSSAPAPAPHQRSQLKQYPGQPEPDLWDRFWNWLFPAPAAPPPPKRQIDNY